MPFISEEIWHLLRTRSDASQSISLAKWPSYQNIDEVVLADFSKLSAVVGGIRNIRKEKNIANKNALVLKVKVNNEHKEKFNPVIAHLCNIESIESVDEKIEKAFSFISNNNEYYIPFSEDIDIEAEKMKVANELEYTRGFLNSIEKKLSNERFVNNAPEQVVAGERKKQDDALNKIKILEDKLASFN